jgi:hypothetical protein
MACEMIVFHFNAQDGNYIEKSNIEILDHAKGIVEVDLTDFEIQGLAVGNNQDCGCKVYMQDATEYTILFSSSINVEIKEDRKVWL